MTRDLYMKGVKKVIQVDDLIFDGNNLIIPSYWTDCVLDYISNFNQSSVTQADSEDFISFKKFLTEVQKNKNSIKTQINVKKG